MYSQPEKNNLIPVRAITGQRKPADAAAGFRDNRPLAAAQRKMCGVIQRANKIINTAFGYFYVDKYEKNKQKTGVNIELSFNPELNKAYADKIGMVQSVHTEDMDGIKEYDPRIKSRITAKGYKIDRLSHYSVPVYGVEENTQNLENISERNVKYALGKSSSIMTNPAMMKDEPCGYARADFETTALALSGTDKGKYYGSVTWGFENEDCGCCGHRLKIKPVTLASMGDPTSNFMEAADKWNNSRSNQTLKLKNAIGVSEVKVYQNTPARRPTDPSTAYVDLADDISIKIKLNDSEDVKGGRFCKDTVCSLETMRSIDEGEQLFWHVSVKKRDLKGGYCRLSDNINYACFFVSVADVELDDTTGTPNIPLPM